MRANELPLYYNAATILEDNAKHRPHKVALYCAEREATFLELNQEANQVANAMSNLGLRPAEVVAIALPDCPEWVTSFFGTLKCGGVAAGLNTLLTGREYVHILNDSRARVLVVHESLLATFANIRSELKHLQHVVVVGDGSNDTINFDKMLGQASQEFATCETHREDLCTLNYSSGTTGEPKGICHAHKDLPLSAKLWGVNVLGLEEKDRTFALAKLFFTFGLGGNLIFPWSVGASVVLYGGSPRKPQEVLQAIEKFCPTVFYNVPTGYASALALEGFPKRYNLSSLRQCVSAGEALPAPVWQDWKKATGLDIVDGIGSTENFHIFLSNRPEDIRPGSSGKPFHGYDVKIVDELGDSVAPGEVGNLMVRGETSSLSYLHDARKSRHAFRGEWLFTGDKYKVDSDGYYWHAGRSDDMMKVGGIWVSPNEVERALLAHGAVLECAVIPKEDTASLVKPMAFIVVKPDVLANEELTTDLLSHCRENMAPYKRPRWVAYVESLPRTATGKVQRFRLRDAA